MKIDEYMLYVILCIDQTVSLLLLVMCYDKDVLLVFWVMINIFYEYFFFYIFTASVGKSAGGSKMVSASVMEADNMFQGFSYVPPAEDAFS